MLGRPKPVIFEPYGSRRARRRGPPRWLILLLVGVGLGVGGVILVQERYMAPRLSAHDAAELRTAFERAESERVRLQAELGTTTKKLDATLAEKQALTTELAKSRDATEHLKQDVSSVLASLPPDPRGGAIEVRTGRFAVEGGKLVYDVMLSRKRTASTPFTGVVQFVVSGESNRGGDNSFSSKPMPLSIDAYQSVRGALPIPDGFKPTQATIRVLDRPDGRQQGMRVLFVE